MNYMQIVFYAAVFCWGWVLGGVFGHMHLMFGVLILFNIIFFAIVLWHNNRRDNQTADH